MQAFMGWWITALNVLMLEDSIRAKLVHFKQSSRACCPKVFLEHTGIWSCNPHFNVWTSVWSVRKSNNFISRSCVFSKCSQLSLFRSFIVLNSTSLVLLLILSWETIDILNQASMASSIIPESNIQLLEICMTIFLFALLSLTLNDFRGHDHLRSSSE